jgi:flavin-dependent thymidylate synthase
MPQVKVRLINIFPHAFDNFLATARTCYSRKGVVMPEELSVPEGLSEEEKEQRREKKTSFARSLYEAGHHTTLQHAYVQFALEGVSRHFIWSFLHSHPFYNSEQVSQRYVPVSPESIYVPPSLSERGKEVFTKSAENRLEDYYALCELLREKVTEDYLSRFTGRAGSKRAERDIQRKTQEIARYVLPVATVAYLYHTINIVTLFRYWRLVYEFDTPEEQRQVVHAMVKAVLARERDFGAILDDPLPLEETPEYAFFAERASDSLFGETRRWEIDIETARKFISEFDSELGEHASRLVDFGARNEQVLANAVREVFGLPESALSDDEAIALALDPARNRLYGEALNLSLHSKLGRVLVHPSYTFRKRLSHAADSQDQRHRATPASRPILMRHYTGEPDYYVPRIVQVVPSAHERYKRAMDATWRTMNELLDAGEPPEAVAYLLPNAVNIRFTESGTLFGLHHKMAMRLCYNSQEEIWRACLDEAEEVTRVNPRIGRWLLPPCSLRKAANRAPYCPEGDRFCGVAVWRLERSDYERLV